MALLRSSARRAIRALPSAHRAAAFHCTPRQEGMVSTIGTLGIVGIFVGPAIPQAQPYINTYLPKAEHKAVAVLAGAAIFGTMASMGGEGKKVESRTEKESRELQEVKDFLNQADETGASAALSVVEGLETVHTDAAPAAIGPYCQGIKCGGIAYMSGQIAMHPSTGEIAPAIKADVEGQTVQVMKNVDEVLKAAGTDKNHVIKATVFVTDLADFARVNKKYSEYFGTHKPARSCVQVAALPKGALVEVEVTAKL